MPNFVKGQLVKCIAISSDHDFHELKIDTVYKVEKSWYDNGRNFILLENNCYCYDTTKETFHTVIYCINDVVRGMELTLFQENCRHKVEGEDSLKQTIYIADCGWHDISDFKEFVNKDKYEVIPFSIVDIYKTGDLNCWEFISKYSKLLTILEKGNNLNIKIVSMRQIRSIPLLNDNLKYLEEKGFIKKIKKIIKDVKLEVGTVLKLEGYSGIFELITLTGNSDRLYFLYSISGNNTLLNNPETKIAIYNIPIDLTLKKLNQLWYKNSWCSTLQAWSLYYEI